MVNRDYILNRLKSRSTTIDDFNFDKLQAPPIYSLLSPTDIGDLYHIAHSIKYSAKPKLKYEYINQIMNRRGFVKIGAGTNRICYAFREDHSFVAKVAYDDIGRGDNPAEFRNQFLLKPFVTKIFEVTPCGTLGFAERVNQITSREEFITIADDVFTLITEFLIGDYVLADIGSTHFMNFGLRPGFGCVLLDFPYVYKLDGKKLYCAKPEPTSPTGYCDGEIDYDDGFNYLMCKKCSARYKAIELAVKDNGGTSKMIIKEKGGLKMKVKTSGGSLDVESVKEVGGNNRPTMNININNKPLKKGKKDSKPNRKAVNGVNETEKRKITPTPNTTSTFNVEDESVTIVGEGSKIVNSHYQAGEEYDPLTKISKIEESNRNLIHQNDKLMEENTKLMNENTSYMNEIVKLKEKIKEMTSEAKEIPTKESGNSPIEFYNDSTVEAAGDLIKEHFESIVELSGLLSDADCNDLINEFDKYKKQCDRNQLIASNNDNKEDMTEEDHYNAACKNLIDFEDHFDCVESENFFMSILKHEVLARMYKLYDYTAHIVVNDKNTAVVKVYAGFPDDDDNIINFDNLTKEVPIKNDEEGDMSVFMTEEHYDDIVNKSKDELDDLKAKYEDLKESINNETVKLEVSDSKESSEESEDAFSDVPIWVHGVVKNMKDIFPNFEDKKVIILEDSEGEFITGGNNSLIAIDRIDNQNLSELEIVSGSWFHGIKEMLAEMDGDNDTDEVEEDIQETEEAVDTPVGAMPPVGVNGVQ